MKLLSFVVLFCGLLISQNCLSQTVALNYKNTKLNEILLDLNERYKAQISISSRLSSKCSITIHKNVSSLDEAMTLLAENCDLEVQKIGDVYTFRKQKRKEKPKEIRPRKKRFLFQGEILDKHTLEPLPYAIIRIGNKTMRTDNKGRFSYRSLSGKEHLCVKHLGYTIKDTTLSFGNKHTIPLVAQILEIPEIKVFESKQNETYKISAGKDLGRIQLNNVGSSFIAGNNNNIVFNNLRLYPGIMAAGESSSDYVIWGSSPGQGQIIFDGITLFNSTGMNGDLGRVNPLVIQDISVFKGGYNVDIGDRIGSVINIESKDGSQKPASTVNVDNEMSSLYISLPIKKRASIQLAARKSYYQLFNIQERFFAKEENYIYPRYDYGDLNLKFTAVLSNRDRLQISSIASTDSYHENFDKTGPSLFRSRLTAESLQIGSSVNYTHTWSKKGMTKVLFTQSLFRPRESFSSISTDEFNQTKDYTASLENGIDEYQLRLSHTFPATEINQLDLSLAIINNNCTLSARSNETQEKYYQSNLNRLSIFILDKLTLWQKFHLHIGIKSDTPLKTAKTYLQPRVNGHIDVGDRWNIHFGWGIYNQFLSKIQLLDSLGAQSLIWSLADGEDSPVQRSLQQAIGGSFLHNRAEFGCEAYFKTFSGLTRYSQKENDFSEQVINGVGYGLDVFSKFRIQKHQIMLTYTLGQFLEYSDIGETTLFFWEAEQSQRHEFKTMINLNFSPIEIGITSVYGSGLTFNNSQSVPYRRVDVALKYSKTFKKVSWNAGLSILNVFNVSNPRIFRTTNFADNSSYRTLGIPFTPTLFFTLSI